MQAFAILRSNVRSVASAFNLGAKKLERPMDSVEIVDWEALTKDDVPVDEVRRKIATEMARALEHGAELL